MISHQLSYGAHREAYLRVCTPYNAVVVDLEERYDRISPTENVAMKS